MMTIREALRTASFKTMATGFSAAIIGAGLAVLGIVNVAKWLIWGGFVVTNIGLVMHLRLIRHLSNNKKKE